jgi:hypothetical protein
MGVERAMWNGDFAVMLEGAPTAALMRSGEVLGEVFDFEVVATGEQQGRLLVNANELQAIAA